MASESSTSPWKHIKAAECPHGPKTSMASKKENQTKCTECAAKNDLRLCLACGFVACCESHNAHNTEHFKKTGHAIIKPYRCDYEWLWCYKCNAFLE